MRHPPTSPLFYTALACLALALALPADRRAPPTPLADRERLEVEAGEYPSDWFGYQRAFPFERINQEAYVRAVEQAVVARSANPLRTSAAGMTWVPAGPYNIGGRVTALAVVPGGTTVYLASANGGVFKSVNGGVNWTPIFDNGAVYSIGALRLDPNDPNIIYCGTGEANAAVDTYDGNGLYRSSDGGASWEFLGLGETRRIARVAVDPSNTARVFVAAMGPQFSTSPDRGLYRSEDGGVSWTKVLFVSDSTGVCDVVVNPAHPETVFAATWERVRHYTYRRAYGPECGIWRSIDSGTTWTRLQNGLPAPSDDVGRIGLAMAPSNPSILYAQIIQGAALGYDGLGMWRTTDGGNTWQKRDVSGFAGAFGGFGWYFGDAVVDPVNPNVVYALGVDLIRSSDGGSSFSSILGSAHVDGHALWIDPANPLRIYYGCDGGFYSSTTGGPSWVKSLDLPITQFYAGTIDPSNPARLLGGTQDNNTLITSGSPTAWTAILGGDGFQCLVDPINPNIIFAESQFCSGGQGLYRIVNGTPNAPAGFVSTDRYNWNSPIAMNPLNHNTLLVGSQRVYRSRNNGISYGIISPDLTTNNAGSLLRYSTLTTLEIARADTNVYYTGSDDGKVYRTSNGGGVWSDVSAGLPVRYVTRVASDPSNALVVYVTLSGFGQDESLAHVFRSTNGGGTWVSIAGNLPDVPANDLIVDPIAPNRLFLATDVGVYVTNDLGGTWYPLGVGLPLQTVFDLTLHNPSRTLVAATHGRSQWKLDLTALPVDVPSQGPPTRLSLSAPAPNPTRGEARFSLELSAGGPAEVAVFDAQGRRVRTVFEGHLESGRHALSWNGQDERGRVASAGVYYIRAEVLDAAAPIRRLVLIR